MLDDEAIHIAIRRPARLDRFILIRTNDLVKRRSKWTAPIQPWTWLDYTRRALLNDLTWLHPGLNGSQPDSPSPMGDIQMVVWLTDSHLVAEVQMHLSVTSVLLTTELHNRIALIPLFSSWLKDTKMRGHFVIWVQQRKMTLLLSTSSVSPTIYIVR